MSERPRSLAERLWFTPRESVPKDPHAPIRSALASSPELRRLFVEHLSDEAVKTLVAVEAATAANNPLALAFAGGTHKAIMDLMALTSPWSKE